MEVTSFSPSLLSPFCLLLVVNNEVVGKLLSDGVVGNPSTSILVGDDALPTTPFCSSVKVAVVIAVTDRCFRRNSFHLITSSTGTVSILGIT